MKSLAKICLVLATVLTMAAYTTQAQTAASTNAPATTAPKAKARGAYSGTIASVDATAETFTITTKSGASKTLHVTSTTRIKKDGEPATSADATAGLKIKGACHPDDSGNMVATTMNIGETKPKAAAPADAAK